MTIAGSLNASSLQNASSGPCAVCMVTDQGYMLPTVVAAIQARKAITTPNADVVILALGLNPETAPRYEDICKANDVLLVTVGRDIFGSDAENSFIDDFFADGYKLTFGALGRLFLDQLLDEKYTDFLYMDGDIQIIGSLDRLIQTSPPDGHFFAASDPKAFWVHNASRDAERARSYMAGIGFKEDEFPRYFNSGVLRIKRNGWKDIGLEAWEYIRKYPDLCISHDQSALNAVGRKMRLPMSLEWNFPPFYRWYGLDRAIDPKVIHYMSRPKPWNGAFAPWGNAEFKVYETFVQQNPAVVADLNRYNLAKFLRYRIQQRLKWADEISNIKRRQDVVRLVEHYQQSVVV